MPIKKKTAKKTAPQTQAWVPSTLPKFKPVSDEITPYGATKFRTPWKTNEYVGTQGSPILAGVLDIDGTMQTFGHGLDQTLLKWCDALQKANPDMVWLVITARDHEFMYETSFNWIMRAFPYPFIGPFCRADNDPRYASEFKRELAQGFEDMGLYRIIAAADDNKFVNDMWKHWATTHFTDPTQFDLLECHSRADYLGWRGGLPSKYTSASSGYGTPARGSSPAGGARPGQHWVSAGWSGKQWVTGHWEKDTPVTATHRPAGQSRYPDGQFGTKDLTETAGWAKYLDARYGPKPNKADSWPRGVNLVSTSALPAVRDAFEAVIEELGTGVTLARADLEDIVGHAHPHWTPVFIADMSMASLRKEAGLSDSDYRDTLYAQIGAMFGTRICDPELDTLTLDEVEAMLDMTRSEIEDYLDRVAFPSVEERPVGMSDEEFAHRKARIDLEDRVMNLRPTLALPTVEAMGTNELEAIVIEVTRDGAALNADEAQVIEVGA